MHKLFNAWCERFGGGKPVTAFRFFFKGKLIDGEQTAADIEGLNSSLKKHTSNPKMQLRTRGGFLNLKSKLHLDFTNVPHAVH